MVTGEAKRLQRDRPDMRVRVVKHGHKVRWHPAWENNPRFALPDEQGRFLTIHAGGGRRPYIERKTPEKWFWRSDWSPEPGEFYPSDDENRFGKLLGGYVIIEPTLKLRASPNKCWPHWQELVDALPEVPFMQLGPHQTLRGVRFAPTLSFRDAWAVLSHSLAYVGPEGGLHHAAAAVKLPAVVIFGGFISPVQTGYALHTNLFTGGEPCGLRVPCRHCDDAMARIPVEWVAEELRKIL